MSNIKRFMEDYIPEGFASAKEFKEMLRTFAENKWWVIVNRRPGSLKPKDFIFRYRADYFMIPEKFIGSSLVQYTYDLFYDAEKTQNCRRKDTAYMKQLEANKITVNARANDEEDDTEKPKRARKKKSDTAVSSNPYDRIGPRSFRAPVEDPHEPTVHYTAAMKRRMAGHANAREDASFVGSDNDE
jgi:hypothetical protein